MKIRVCINFLLGLLILGIPGLRVDAIIKIISIITLCILFFVNNRLLIAQIKNNEKNSEKNKIEIDIKLLVISIVVGIIFGLLLLKFLN